MNQQLVGLQAAQLSYTKISNLSLFNYLRESLRYMCDASAALRKFARKFP